MLSHRLARGLLIYRSHMCNKGNLNKMTLYTSTNLDISGVFPPIPTPFTETEDLDRNALRKNFDKWNKIDLKGYVVLGSNGESAYLESEEKVELVKLCRDFAPNNKLIIAGCGCESTRSTIALAKQMSDAGADALLVITPSFYKGKMSSEALYQHYLKVADASPKPVILYTVPANTTLDLPVDCVVKLASHPNIIGIKESGGQVAKMGLMVHKTKDQDFQVLCGSASYLYPAYAVGAVGAIAALANVLGEECCELDKLFHSGDHAAAKLLQQRLTAPNIAVTAEHGVPGLKHAMDWFGYAGGPTRSPLLPITTDNASKLRSAFSDNGFTPK